MEMSIRIIQVLFVVFTILFIVSVSIAAYGIYHDWPTNPAHATEMKIKLRDVKLKDILWGKSIRWLRKDMAIDVVTVLLEGEGEKEFSASGEIEVTIEREEEK